VSTEPRPVAVVMAGGQGKRFWPASTETIPKQFLSLFGERTLLQQTVDRLKTLWPPPTPWSLRTTSTPRVLRPSYRLFPQRTSWSSRRRGTPPPHWPV